MKRSCVAIACMGAIVIVLGTYAAGCGGGSEADDSATLEGRDWVASGVTGVDSILPSEEGQATAAFEGGTISGSATINRFTGSYETGPGNTIRIEALAATLMAGPEELMAQEAAYLSALEQAVSYTVTAESLELLDAEGGLLVKYDAVEPASLTGTEWQATAYNNGKGGLQSTAADGTTTAVFADDGTLSGNAGVNQYKTTYTVSDDGAMSIDAQIITTKMAGPEELMAQEAAYLAALPQTATYTIDGSELWLRDGDGAALARFIAK